MEDENLAQLTESQRCNLNALLDVLVPAWGDVFPAAGALGVAAFIEARLADTRGFAQVALSVLSRVATLVSAAGMQTLDELAPAERVALVRRVEAEDPMTFLTFLTQVYMGYYTNPTIPPKLGFPDRPPQPLGHKIAEDDNLDELLAPVRQRGRHYREC